MQDKAHACYWLKGVIPAGKVTHTTNEDWTNFGDCSYVKIGGPAPMGERYPTE